MKRIVFCAAFAFSLCGLTAQAQETAPAPAAAAPVADPIGEFMGIVKELATVLEGVKDTQSADAAVPTLESLRARMETCEGGLESAIEKLSPEEQAKVGLDMIGLLGPMMEQAERMEEKGFFGSEALKALLAEDDEDEEADEEDLSGADSEEDGADEDGADEDDDDEDGADEDDDEGEEE